MPIFATCEICIFNHVMLLHNMNNLNFKPKKFIMSKKLKNVLIAFVLLLVSSMGFAQAIKGKVSDASGPLPGVNVTVANAKESTTTDLDGNFSLDNVADGAALEFSFVGYQTQKITVKGDRSLKVTMVSASAALQEVVVVGYGSAKKKDLTGAVAIVTSKEFEGKAAAQFAESLEGKIAGVQIIRPSGQPQGNFSIRIRGISTITAGSEPLYIVDGVPTTSINEISPSDIETISVLKDASSAAIYGSSGANGVVLINTKRGGNKQTTVTFNSYTGISSVVKKMNVLNAAQYKNLMTEMGQSVPNWNDYPYDNNWQDQGYRTAATKNYQFGVSGGNDKTNYYLSGTYLNQEGVVITNSLERYTYKLNIDHKATDRLKVGSSIAYNRWKDIDVDENRKYGSVLALSTGAPVTSVYNSDGTFAINPFIQDLENPIALLLKNEHQNVNYRFKGNVYGELSFLTDFKFKSLFGFEQFNSTYNSWVDPYRSREGRSFKGMAALYNTQTNYWVTENTVSYNKMKNDHNFSALAGYIASENTYASSSINAREFGSTGVQTVNGGAIRTSGYSSSKARNLSMISRFNYSYSDKYYVTTNFRADAYSGFGEANRWGYFPSFSVGWRISKESFLKDVKAISDLKIRAGWGVVGNGQVGEYSHYGLVNPGAPYVIGDVVVPGTTSSTLENRNLKWETTKQTNIGFDLSLLNNRLGVTADYYIKQTNDMLLNKNIPTSTGYSQAIMNIGSMMNKGFEFQVSSKNLVDEVKWTTDFNIAFNKSEITSLPGGSIKLGNISDRGLVAIAQEGQPLGTFYGYVSGGVDPATGDMIYKDLDGSGDLSDGDKTIIGNANPDYTFGVTNDFKYKNWNLNFFIQGVQGNDIFNASRIETEGLFDEGNQLTTVLNHWTPSNTITDIPRVAFGSDRNSKISSRFVEDGSYVRIKAVTLGYNLADNWAKKFNMSKVYFYMTGTNLLTFTKYSGLDPEVSFYGRSTDNSMKNIAQGVDYGTYPQTRDLIFGINITF